VYSDLSFSTYDNLTQTQKFEFTFNGSTLLFGVGNSFWLTGNSLFRCYFWAGIIIISLSWLVCAVEGLKMHGCSSRSHSHNKVPRWVSMLFAAYLAQTDFLTIVLLYLSLSANVVRNNLCMLVLLVTSRCCASCSLHSMLLIMKYIIKPTCSSFDM
jgi:hypothetical protein